jgi:Domain of unknown function (DUF4386)
LLLEICVISYPTCVHRWAGASGEGRLVAFEAALALRQVEIGLAGMLSITGGLTLLALACGVLRSTRYPAWLGFLGLAGGVGMMAAGAAQAATGFSALAMALSMPATVLLLLWITLAGLRLWRLGPCQDQDAV